MPSFHRTRADQRIVIAHRGASGYVPEHTLVAKAVAHAMGVDYIEQDVVLTRDNVAVVLHDIHLDTISNVAEIYPKRARHDGRFYAIDFTVDEVRHLKVHERIDLQTMKPVYNQRFPSGKSHFQIPTLDEEIELIQGINKSTGRDVGIYPEIKAPAWHRGEGRDLSRIVLDSLKKFGYQDAADNVFVQCFDAGELRRLRFDLETNLKLVQLIGENEWNEAPTDFDHLKTADGIDEVSRYAQVIGPSIHHVMTGIDRLGKPNLTELVQIAHARGLAVHTYTLRADDLPNYVEDFEQMLELLFDGANVDGVFTDFPDRVIRHLQARGR